MNIESPQNISLKEGPKWIKPKLEKENGELIRVAETFYDKLFLQENQQAFFDVILNNYNRAEPEELLDSIWSELHNSESWIIEPRNFTQIEEIIGDNRDWRSLKNAMKESKSMETPIIAHLPDGMYHLLSGNTRLCLAKALLIRPKVIIVEFPGTPKKSGLLNKF